MKRKKNMMILLGVLLAAVIVYLLASVLGGEKDDTATIDFTDIKASEITKLRWTYNEKTVEIEKRGDDWILTDDDSYPLDYEKIENMISALSKTKASNEITEPNLSEYGLDEAKPSIWVTAAGEEVSFAIGSTNSTVSRCYLKMSGKDSVYLVSTSFKEAFELTKEDIREDDSIPQVSDISEVKITSFGEVIMHIKGKYNSRGTLVWNNGKEELDMTDVQELCSGLDGLAWTDDFLNHNPTKAQLEEYGLAEPAVEIYWSNGSDKVTLELGNELESGETYARLKGSDTVHTLSEDFATIMQYSESFMNNEE